MITTFFILLGTFLAGTGIVWALTRVILSYAESAALIDIPNDRSSHVSPTPRGGGLSMVIFFLAAISILYAFDRLGIDEFMALFGGSVLVAGIGFRDDHCAVAASWRLVVHSLAAIWSLAWIGGVPVISIGGLVIDPGWFGYPMGVVFLVWFLNLFNFMDGIDGIAGSEALFISLGAAGFCLLSPAVSAADGAVQILIVVAGGCAGFLLWNWPPASIFMGDAGSGFLGFILGLMALITAHREILTIWLWLILFGVFIADATVTLLRRILRGERWYEAHRSHAYQHASRRFQSHRIVTLAVVVINTLWLLPWALAAQIWPDSGFLLSCLALAPLFLFAYRFDAGML
ncbi:MAG: glycosyltransferase family 4 protein [Methylococcaceae bacterium]|nr:glycosyltransferase family 4 protein [Methylococcaceae bacterium]MCI0734247.1 glycosyltransferase family 4 protein [Methylococcaceae bacterium]